MTTGSETRPVISLDRTEPIWTTLATEAANKYVMRKFTSLEEVMDTSSCRVVETHAIEVRIYITLACFSFEIKYNLKH